MDKIGKIKATLLEWGKQNAGMYYDAREMADWLDMFSETSIKAVRDIGEKYDELLDKLYKQIYRRADDLRIKLFNSEVLDPATEARHSECERFLTIIADLKREKQVTNH